jgi:uncharacterized protein with PIN domain
MREYPTSNDINIKECYNCKAKIDLNYYYKMKSAGDFHSMKLREGEQVFFCKDCKEKYWDQISAYELMEDIRKNWKYT